MERIKNSLAAKIFLWVACALLLCSLLIYGLVMVMIPWQYTAVANHRLNQALETLAAEIDGTDTASASTKIYNFCIQNHAVVILTTGEESVVFGEDDGLEKGENTYSLSLPLRFSDVPEGSVLTVTASGATAGEITRTFFQLLPAVLGIILLLASLSAWFCSKLIAEPVRQLSGVSQRMAQMDMTWHCETTRTDELGTLANSLNTLSDRLTQTMGELESANRQLLEDIASFRTLEKQRRDFFAAASHELKTPITILKGQLESMVLGIGDYKHHEKYLPQALDTVESMEVLIQEILGISKMESGLLEASFVQEPLVPLVEDCIAGVRPLAEEKQIAINMRQEKPPCCVRIHRQLFEKAVSNVLSNAVRYSPPKERVSITLTERKLTVENTGITLAEEDMDSLFTPFYRVDPSRNRKSGGSGLGLYLVKTILDLHGFDGGIENTENAVRFTIRFHQN